MQTLDISTFDGAVLSVIRGKIEQYGLPVSLLAEVMGTGLRHLQLILNGKRPLTIRMLTRLAAELSTTPQQIHTEANKLGNE